MKRTLAHMLAVVLALLLMTACGAGGNTPTTGSSDPFASLDMDAGKNPAGTPNETPGVTAAAQGDNGTAAATPAAAAPIPFVSVLEYGGKVYAADTFCIEGWELMEDADVFCIYGNQLYYIEGWIPDGYGGTLYQRKPDGGKKLLAEYCDLNAYLMDGRIYYAGAETEDGEFPGIYCYDLKIGGKTRIIGNAFIISCDSDYIYYRPEEGGVYRCGYTGTGAELFTNLPDYDWGFVYKDHYYCAPWDGSSIYKTETKSGGRFERVTFTDEYFTSFHIQSDWVYYIYDHSVYRCRLDGSGAQKLCALQSESYGAYPFIVVGESLYYVEEYESEEGYTSFLYEVSITGGVKTITDAKWFAD